MKFTAFLVLLFVATTGAAAATEPVKFHAVTVMSGNWSEARTWMDGRKPRPGDFVQIRGSHRVVYDVDSPDVIRMVHVAGTLTFSREKNTRLEVGLIKIEPGETTTEDGFDCHDAAPTRAGGELAAVEIGTPDAPIAANVTAIVRLHHFEGTNTDTLPAVVACGGRWDVHGSPMSRTWLKLAASARVGDTKVKVEHPVRDWRVGDRIIVTSGSSRVTSESGQTFMQRAVGRERGVEGRARVIRSMPVGTEERVIRAIDDDEITLDRALETSHPGDGANRCEVANLSRNVVIESAAPAGVRGHTMYHHGSSGSISYAEFRHLGKDGILGKYAIHFHLVRDTMRGSGVRGASIWDSHNRWITVHGTDHLLIRDCVGYQSRGHGYFLEDATEQWNVFDRNLAVQAYGTSPLPGQVLEFDPNDGAGFWWANARNTFIRNVACENDRYGFHFHLAEQDFNPLLWVRSTDGKVVETDVRTIPFLRFEDNESHNNGLFGFRLGGEIPGSVRGDAKHPFIARNLRVWEEHYAIRPNISFFLLDGLRVADAAYGIYHPAYDMHVYRDVEFSNVSAEPLNGGHGEANVPQGDVTFDGLRFRNCSLDRDPLIQLTFRSFRSGLSGHYRGVHLTDSTSKTGIVGFGGGPRTDLTDNPIRYYFHDTPAKGAITHVAYAKGEVTKTDDSFQPATGWSASDVRVSLAKDVSFPDLLEPVDDVPPASLITGVQIEGKNFAVRGISHDNGEIATVTVNGMPAKIVTQHAGVADWTIKLPASADDRFEAKATDQAGNLEARPHVITSHRPVMPPENARGS